MFNTYKVNAWPLMNSLLDPLLTATLLTALIFQSLKLILRLTHKKMFNERICLKFVEVFKNKMRQLDI
jgi:hypothetical protein